MRVRPAPEVRRYEGWRFASFDEGTAALRRLAQDGPRPTVLRLSDETETLIGLAQPDAVGASLERQDAGCLAVVGFEGTGEDTAHRREGAAEILRESGGTFAGEEPGERWAHGRYSAPYLRDALLDAGALAETLETAALWSRLPALYAAVREALTATLTAAGTPPLVMCHISHVYENGASLYFTVVSAQGRTPWRTGPGPSTPPTTPSSPRAAPSPTTTPWAPTTATGTSGRRAPSASRPCAPSSGAWTPPDCSARASCCRRTDPAERHAPTP